MPWTPGCCGGRHGPAGMMLEEQIAYAAQHVGKQFVDGIILANPEETRHRCSACDKCKYNSAHKCKRSGELFILFRPLKNYNCPDERW